jgi:DNA-binding transcriptional regulator YiaG
MKTENRNTMLETILVKLNPADLVSRENRQLIIARIENLREQTGLNHRQFGDSIRQEIASLRTWLAGTRDLTVETLADICCIFGITLGDLVIER